MILPKVIFEDASIIVIDKPVGLSSEAGTIAALREAWGDAGAYVGIVHRLDTAVSGLMVCAKTPAAAAELSRQITQTQAVYAGRGVSFPQFGASNVENQGFIKKYRAVAVCAPGKDLPAEGVMQDYLFKDSRSGRVYPVKRMRRGVKEAVLEYRTAASVQNPAGEGKLLLAEVTLHTGRTHQIRAQFASRGCPLWGDGKYGSREKGVIALQSAHLSFSHPASGEYLSFDLPAPNAAPWTLF